MPIFPLPAWSGSVAPAGTGRRWRSSLPVPSWSAKSENPERLSRPGIRGKAQALAWRIFTASARNAPTATGESMVKSAASETS